MANLIMNLTADDKKASLTLDDVNHDNVSSIITGIFSVFGAATTPLLTGVAEYVGPTEFGRDTAHEAITHIEDKKKSVAPIAAQDSNKIFRTKPYDDRPRATFEQTKPESEVVFSTKVSTVEDSPLYHAMAKAGLEVDSKPHVDENFDPGTMPEFYRTGIKIKTIKGLETKCYRTRYVCPECDNKGKHYIPEGTDHVTCHNCQTDITVRDAGPVRGKDSYGHFYNASGYHNTVIHP
ncbi:hypothetical protein ACK8P5_25995 (plasmid) [Paenibacillus sp. EC2-1]|uniref:hypothetical protein n=1 Tax=Paenibacillus sp. EC2-1 TaxID=3388665 RepID=UPI003BEEEA2B